LLPRFVLKSPDTRPTSPRPKKADLNFGVGTVSLSHVHSAA
jgi:hypothetical protein